MRSSPLLGTLLHHFGGICVLLGTSTSFHPARTALYNILQKPRDIQAKAFYTALDRTIELHCGGQQSDDASVRFGRYFASSAEERLARTLSF
jgi:hypothetical protein